MRELRGVRILKVTSKVLRHSKLGSEQKSEDLRGTKIPNCVLLAVRELVDVYKSQLYCVCIYMHTHTGLFSLQSHIDLFSVQSQRPWGARAITGRSVAYFSFLVYGGLLCSVSSYIIASDERWGAGVEYHFQEI